MDDPTPTPEPHESHPIPKWLRRATWRNAALAWAGFTVVVLPPKD